MSNYLPPVRPHTKRGEYRYRDMNTGRRRERARARASGGQGEGGGGGGGKGFLEQGMERRPTNVCKIREVADADAGADTGAGAMQCWG